MGCSNDNYWKLDKWDKIGIASLIVFFTIFVVLNTFSFASGTDEVDFEVVDNLVILSNSNFFQSRPGYSVGYFELDNDYIYHITFNSPRAIAFSNSVPSDGVPYYEYSSLSAGTTLDLYPTHDYVIFNFSSASDVTVTRTSVNSMSSAVSILSNSISLSFLWSVFNKVIPYILIVVLASFGIYLISHSIKEISKGREI